MKAVDPSAGALCDSPSSRRPTPSPPVTCRQPLTEAALDAFETWNRRSTPPSRQIGKETLGDRRGA